MKQKSISGEEENSHFASCNGMELRKSRMRIIFAKDGKHFLKNFDDDSQNQIPIKII